MPSVMQNELSWQVPLHPTNNLGRIIPGLHENTLDQGGNLCSLDNGRHRLSPTNALGCLDRLPLELLHMVLAQLDIRALTDFRRVNQRAMQVVDWLLPYDTIVTYAPVLLRGILSIGAGQFISCQELYKKLCTSNCDICGEFGGYIYLITCRRVCFHCFTEEIEFLPIQEGHAFLKLGLSKEELASLPMMKSITGTYSSRKINVYARYTLIDHRAAYEAGITLHGDSNVREDYTLGRSGNLIVRETGQIGDYDGESSNPIRFMAIARSPFLDLRAGSLVWGFQCVAYKDQHICGQRIFTTESFRNHINQYGKIKDGKHRR